MTLAIHSPLWRSAAVAGAVAFALAVLVYLSQGWGLAVLTPDGSIKPVATGPTAIGAALGLLAVTSLSALFSMTSLFNGYTERGKAERASIRASDTAREKYDVALKSLIEIVAATLATNGRYDAILAKAEIDLKKVVTPHDAQSAVAKLLVENASIKGEVETLKNRLEASHSETQALRRELETARSEGEIDSLTKLKNRRWFDTNFGRDVSQARSASQPMCLAFLDIDHFKRINDTFGHTSGDAILQWCGEMLRQNVKGRDTAVRYGGEEFAISLPHTDLKGATRLMEGIRTELQKRKWVHTKSGREIGIVTASIGIAQMRDNENMEALIERADANLYAAKSSGRNRVVGTA